MPRIAAVTARQILDSRGIPTVEVTVELDNGITATSSAPSGSIANKVEALELRDHNSAEYFGMGVSKAVENVNTVINQKLVGQDPLYQTQIDQMLVDLDGTVNKSKLGANAILATSQAVIKTAAESLKLPLFIYVKEKYQLIQAYRIPTPIFNLMNGGRHGSGTLDFQEFQLVPASHLPYSKALRIGVEMFMALERVLEQKGAIRTVGVEGGFSPNLATNTDALEIFSEAMKLTSYTLAQDAFLGLDVAPKWFYKGGKYTVKDRPQPMTGKQMVKFYQDMHHQYRVFAFEDPLIADAWADWKFMTAEMGETAMVVADDLITTNKTLLMKAIQEQACNAVVIKPNRIGTVTEAIEIISLAKQAGWHTIMSHRSGETTDDILADIAVGVGTDYVKFGAPSRGERVTKYNRLLRIEEILVRSKQQTAGEPAMADTFTAPQSTAPTSMNTSAPAVPNLPSWSQVSADLAPAAVPTAPATVPDSAAAPSPTAGLTPTPVGPLASEPAVSPAPMPSSAPMASVAPVAPTMSSTPVVSPAMTAPAPESTQSVAPMPSVTMPTTPMPTLSSAPTLAPSMPAMPSLSVSSPEPMVNAPQVQPIGEVSVSSPTPSSGSASPAPEQEISQLQNSLNELASMVAPASEPTPSVAPMPSVAMPATPTLSSAPTPAVSSPEMPSMPTLSSSPTAPSAPVMPSASTLQNIPTLSISPPSAPTAPQPGPAGLIPPTPPTLS